MASHLVALVVFSALVAVVLGMIARDDARARLRFGARVFTALVVSAVVLGWLMSRLPD